MEEEKTKAIDLKNLAGPSKPRVIKKTVIGLLLLMQSESLIICYLKDLEYFTFCYSLSVCENSVTENPFRFQ